MGGLSTRDEKIVTITDPEDLQVIKKALQMLAKAKPATGTLQYSSSAAEYARWLDAKRAELLLQHQALRFLP